MASGRWKPQVVTAILIAVPLLGVVAAALGVIRPRITLLDGILAVSFYAVSGHGLTAGFHRLFTHRSFKAARWVKITLAIAGSLGMEGSVISWVANHRRHHAFTDREDDPHSPYEYGDGTWQQIRGALHAHVGWLFQAQATEEESMGPGLGQGSRSRRYQSTLSTVWRCFIRPADADRMGAYENVGRSLGRVDLGWPRSASSSCTMPLSRSTRSAICGDADRSSPESMTKRRTSLPWQSSPWEKTGTTFTTPVPRSPVMVWIVTNSTPRRVSSGFFRVSGPHGT